MAKKPKEEQAFITASYMDLVKLWSNQSNVLMAAVAGWYAATDAAKDWITPEQFASGMALWGLLNIVLRSLNQPNTEIK